MSAPDSDPGSISRNPNWFQTTHWSVVIAAGASEGSHSRGALEALCRAYWPPVFSFLRRRGYGIEDTEDLTQGFFAHILETGFIRKADRERGRFRSFLLASLQHYVADESKKARRQKRGEGCTLLSLDLQFAESFYRSEFAEKMSPSRIFMRHWALAVLDRALRHLTDVYREAGKARLFGQLQGALSGDTAAVSYRDSARVLGMTEAAVKMAVQRMRKRYYECVRQEIAQTVADPDEIEDELRCLMDSLG